LIEVFHDVVLKKLSLQYHASQNKPNFNTNRSHISYRLNHCYPPFKPITNATGFSTYAGTKVAIVEKSTMSIRIVYALFS